MKNYKLIVVFLCLVHLIEASQGSSAFFQSTISLVAIAVFSALVLALLVYSCLMDIKHWRKSIDARAQLAYPTASPAEFQLPPMFEPSENHLILPMSEAARKIETAQSTDDKTMRIVKAMYTSSNRDVPESVQQSLQSHRRSHPPRRAQKTTTTLLTTISESRDENESSKKEQ